jgi:hypothetical protein
MRTRHTLIASALAAIFRGVVMPALAEARGGTEAMPDENMGVSRTGHGASGGMGATFYKPRSITR